MSKNTVKKNCPFYNHPKSCKMLEIERNCYLCPLVEVELRKKDLEKAQIDIFKLERENKDLKILLGEKIVKEYQERTRQKRSDT